MTAKLLVLYPTPDDAEAFETYYLERHVPLVKAVPGLRSATRNAGPIGTPEGPAPYHQVSTYAFDSMADLQRGLESAEGGAAAADLGRFAPAGTTLLIMEEQEL